MLQRPVGASRRPPRQSTMGRSNEGADAAAVAVKYRDRGGFIVVQIFAPHTPGEGLWLVGQRLHRRRGSEACTTISRAGLSSIAVEGCHAAAPAPHRH